MLKLDDCPPVQGKTRPSGVCVWGVSSEWLNKNLMNKCMILCLFYSFKWQFPFWDTASVWGSNKYLKYFSIGNKLKYVIVFWWWNESRLRTLEFILHFREVSAKKTQKPLELWAVFYLFVEFGGWCEISGWKLSKQLREYQLWSDIVWF